MIFDTLLAAYCFVFLLITVPGVYIVWQNISKNKIKIRWFQQGGFLIAILLLFAGGIWASCELGKKADTAEREILISNVSAVALTLNPQRLQALSFTTADEKNPAFQRITEQMKAAVRVTGLRYVFSVAEREGKFVFGPESLNKEDPLASPPGTVYARPPEELKTVFNTGRSVTTRLYTDEYGTFITALVPILNPSDNSVLMVVGADTPADIWQAAMLYMRSIPLLLSLVLIALLMAGNRVVVWRQTLSIERQLHWRHIEAALCLATSLALTFSVAWLLHETEKRARQQAFSALARAHAGAITESMFDLRMRLASLGNMFEGSDWVTREEFQHFASILATDGLSQSWEWARAVAADALDDITAEAQAHGILDFTVWERDENRQRVPLGKRDVYYPVLYVAPEIGNDMVYGYDVGSESVRRKALEETLQTGMATGTDPIILVQESGVQQGMLVFHPVYKAEKLHGFALLTFRFRPMLLRAIAQAGRQDSGLSVELFQVSQNDEAVHLASSSSDDAPVDFFGNNSGKELCVKVPLCVFGKSYAVVVHAKPEWLATHPLWTGQTTLIAGFLISLILAAFIMSFSRHRAFLAHEVAQRTSALQASEQLLSREQTKLKRILDGIPYGVYLVDRNYSIRYLNPAMLEMFGEHQGRKCYEYLHKFQSRCSWCVNDRVFSGESVKWECRECKPGHFFEVHDTPITDSDGTPCKLSVFSDITEIKSSQEALRLNEARLAATLNSIGDGVISTDISGVVVGVNQAAARLTGWEQKESLGRSIEEIFDIINGNTHEKAVNPVWETLEKGVVVELANHTILVARDGTERNIADSCAPVRTAAGKIIGAVLVFRDVTDEYRTRRELATSNERFKQTAAQSGEIIWEIDTNGLYTYVSAAVADILGYTEAEVVNKIHYYDLLPEQGREQFRAGMREILKQRQPLKKMEYHVRHKDGHIVTLIANGLPMLDDKGDVIGYRGSSRDITERKQMETAIIESRQRLESILNAVDDVIWSASPFPNIKLQYMTPSVVKLYGHSVSDFMDNPFLWREVILEEDLHSIKDIWKLLNEKGTVDVEYRIRRPDKSLCWVRDRRQCIYDEQNCVVRIDGIISDISSLKLIQEALRESEATYRVLFEGSRDAMVIYDSASEKFTAANSAALQLFKVDSLQEFKGFGFLDLSPDIQPGGSESALALQDFITAALHGGAHYFEWTYMRSDGTAFPATVLLNRLTLDNRILLQATIRDITSEKQAELELQLSREQYMLAVNGANDGIFDWDLRTGSLYLSPKWKKMIGYEDDDLPNVFQTFEDNIHPDDKPRVADYLDEYLKGKIQNYAIEFRFRHRDGHYIWILARGEALRDEKGVPYRMAGSHSDITERKEAEEKLRESEARINTVLNAAQDAIIMMDNAGNISVWNAAAERMFGYTSAETLGKNLHRLLAPAEYLDAHMQAFPIFQKTGEGAAVGKVLELSALDKSGRKFPVELSLSSVQLRGEWHAVGIIRDITERKKAEEELRQTNRQLQAAIELANEMAANAEMANAAKSAFLANVSHEIRTPLNGIIGMTSLLLDTKLTRQQQHHAEVIRESGESLLWLINDILDFSKIEAGKLEIECIDFDLHSLIDDFSMVLAVKAQEKNLEFVCAADPDTPALLRGDPGRLRQILTNLAGNAIKFTHQGEVVVKVSLLEENEEGALLHFSVKDTGIGIPAEKQRLLFQSFTQVDPSTTRKYGGTGLGLAITKQLVELMHGRIGMWSEEGKGSEFWFEVRLPVRREVAHTVAPSVDLRGVRALVVDDNATNREMLCAQLSAIGIIPDEAPDGMVALEMLKTAYEAGKAYNLAVLDMLMPGLDGESLGIEIHNNEKLKDTALVMMTSIGRRGDARRLEELGFAAYLTKPVRQSDLFDCLAIAMGHDEESVGANVKQRKRPIVTRHSVRELRQYHARVLLAEDNLVNQQVALGILKKFHVAVEVANNGAEAIKALKRSHFDLVLMDVQMPEMDGFEATRIIRNSSPAILDPNVPIIAMTAHASRAHQKKCEEAGMNDHLAKPLDPEVLLAVLKKWLPEKKKMKQDCLIPKKENMATNDALFDREGLLSRVMGDQDLARLLVSTFLGDMPRQIEALRVYLERNDCEGATRQAHTIKGASANVGATALSLAAAAMERAGKSGDMESMRATFSDLEKQYQLTEQAMENT